MRIAIAVLWGFTFPLLVLLLVDAMGRSGTDMAVGLMVFAFFGGWLGVHCYDLWGHRRISSMHPPQDVVDR